MTKKRRPTEREKNLKAIRDLEHWAWHGNTTNRPGGKFKSVIGFILAVQCVTKVAKESIERRDLAAKAFGNRAAKALGR